MPARRSGLGRGLDALLPGGADSPVQSSGLLEAPIDAIDANPSQPRRAFDPETLDELATSIEQIGVLQPLVVRPAGERYELVAGERRLRAAKKAGLTTVPVVVVETDARGSLERALVENLHRDDLNPIEEAAAYKALIDEGGLTQDELGKRLGRNRVTISNSLRLLELPVAIQRLMIEGRLSAGHGKVLLGLAGNPFQERLAVRAAQESASVRATEDLVRRYQAISGDVPARGRGGGSSKPVVLTDAQRALADHLQTRVRIEMGRRKGRIVLDFVSPDELDRLMKIILAGSTPPTTHTASPDGRRTSG
jgi:ParB family transcriptional regulator, chromosome partitioning protein